VIPTTGYLEAFVAEDNLAVISHKVLNTSVDHIESRAALNGIGSTRSVCRVDNVMAWPALKEIRGSGYVGSLLPIPISCNEIIVARTTCYTIRAGLANDKVIAGPAAEQIVAGAAIDVVVATKAPD
jgi:hypothetical protein